MGQHTYPDGKTYITYDYKGKDDILFKYYKIKRKHILEFWYDGIYAERLECNSMGQCNHLINYFVNHIEEVLRDLELD